MRQAASGSEAGEEEAAGSAQGAYPPNHAWDLPGSDGEEGPPESAQQAVSNIMKVLICIQRNGRSDHVPRGNLPKFVLD